MVFNEQLYNLQSFQLRNDKQKKNRLFVGIYVKSN